MESLQGLSERKVGANDAWNWSEFQLLSGKPIQKPDV